MTHLRTLRRPPALALLAVVTGLCLAACGSSSGSSTAAGSAAPASSSGANSGSGRRSALVACLKAHGVTLPPRPAGSRRPPAGSGAGAPPGGAGGFFGGGGPARGFAAGPKLRAAFQACGGRRFRGRQVAFSHAAITRFAACVKQHGYTLPTPNFSGKGPIYPARIERNTRFQAAARACRGDLRPAGAPAPSGAPGTSTTSASSTAGA